MSETSNQLNPQQNSGAVNPNSTKVEKTEPVSPGQATTAQTTNPTQTTGPSSNIAFHSAAIGTQTARPKDYFAEQNQETLTKKQAHSTRIRWLLIFSCGLVGVALVIGLIWWIIASITKTEPVDPSTSDTTQGMQFNDDTIDENMAELQEQVNSAFAATVIDDGEGTVEIAGDLTAAEKVFAEVLNNPENSSYTSQINLTKLIFYVDNGEYERAISIIPEINVDKLTGEQKVSYYNNLFIAYTSLGDTTTANDYLKLQTTTQIEIGGGGQG